ncbi:hypothetical protein [Spongiactinospora sp. TRM90649]|uniref:hypothetical protein n=1 Tax=Spongiactinospora sp. TRM90649 TaxID=3031114 RepID=UPI0023F668F3|nr:hypothetical protein [Spongiactinospora sp. TRM90649]MDF5756260.1 hypothetical protein [Spongiactinospora sp. TRM90649]
MISADGWPLPDATRIHLGEIAGAYATELTLGADLGDPDMTQDSALRTTPDPFQPTRIPGLYGAFRLSPEDTFRFMTTFTATADSRRPFDNGMDTLLQRLLPPIAEQSRTTGDITRMDRLFRTLGNVRGFELAAAVRVLQPQDERAEEAKDAESLLAGTLMGAFGLIPPFSIIPKTWTALSTGVAVKDTYGPQPKNLVQETEKLDGVETLARQHVTAQLLMEQGFVPKVPPSGFLAGPDGALRPFSEIIEDGNTGMQAFEQWLIENGMGTNDEFSVGESSLRVARNFDGGKDGAYHRARLYTNTLTTD